MENKYDVSSRSGLLLLHLSTLSPHPYVWLCNRLGRPWVGEKGTSLGYELGLYKGKESLDTHRLELELRISMFGNREDIWLRGQILSER